MDVCLMLNISIDFSSLSNQAMEYNHGINKLEQDLIKLDIKVNQSDALHFVVINDIKHIQIIKNCDLDELRELGSGTFGAVYHGKWRGPFVAIKRIHDIYFAGKSWIQEQARADFWNEIFMLANLHHPNIITFYDIVWDGSRGSFVAITEYMVDSSVGDLGNLGLSKKFYCKMEDTYGGSVVICYKLPGQDLDTLVSISYIEDLAIMMEECDCLLIRGLRIWIC
ncbi:hypothetical protein IEQ34_016652 [Dendrobium chrysotoxum]|uniref:Protein kinase domain-containing protein n=1 Tax=Dendrobium chrysotoxum TaxID=161865 RepID=A0AAV7GH38_DENCH|nr:hypothetical protein IEQ34_016652 [Dendrobium chrysotoxum]